MVNTINNAIEITGKLATMPFAALVVPPPPPLVLPSKAGPVQPPSRTKKKLRYAFDMEYTFKIHRPGRSVKFQTT